MSNYWLPIHQIWGHIVWLAYASLVTALKKSIEKKESKYNALKSEKESKKTLVQQLKNMYSES